MALIAHPSRRFAAAKQLGSLYAMLDREVATALACMVSSLTDALRRPYPVPEQAALLAAIGDAIRGLRAVVTEEVLGGRRLPESEYELEMLRAAATALSRAALSPPRPGTGADCIVRTLP